MKSDNYASLNEELNGLGKAIQENDTRFGTIFDITMIFLSVSSNVNDLVTESDHFDLKAALDQWQIKVVSEEVLSIPSLEVVYCAF